MMLPHTVSFRLAFTVRVPVAFRTPRVSGTGDAHCISRGFTFLSNCAVQRMRAWSLPALLFLSEPVCRSVGRRPDSARCARTAPDSPLRVVSACDTYQLINATYSEPQTNLKGVLRIVSFIEGFL